MPHSCGLNLQPGHKQSEVAMMVPWYQRHCFLSLCSVYSWTCWSWPCGQKRFPHCTFHGHHICMHSSLRGKRGAEGLSFPVVETPGRCGSHSDLIGQNVLTWPSQAAEKAGNEVFLLDTIFLAKTGVVTIEEGSNKYLRTTSCLCPNIIFDDSQMEHVIGCGFDFGTSFNPLSQVWKTRIFKHWSCSS